jgi:hypothetical protein
MGTSLSIILNCGLKKNDEEKNWRIILATINA